ncbi:hypothetical protein HAX54_044594 [Datura stramonium]|uniref:Fe2OG dioxygenase domain-containing protein n=1 Tax=Datura stramonium TaxID=4076 RepID=A0ABS8SPR2_DATST|nr:hypothetical protein [Datura stramonium]
MDEARQVWREFFHQPMDVKQAYANTPKTYEGYGNRLGLRKDSDRRIFKASGELLWAFNEDIINKCGLKEDVLQNAFGGEDIGACLRAFRSVTFSHWITVKPASHAFIVNIGDQIQVLSNGIYKSVEHRVIVNSAEERVSLAFFYNPKSDLMIEPAKELLTTHNIPPLYPPRTFINYRLYIRTKGPQGITVRESNKLD